MNDDIAQYAARCLPQGDVVADVESPKEVCAPTPASKSINDAINDPL